MAASSSYVPAQLDLMGLADDILPNIVEQLCGGDGAHDITLWRHACRLAQTCSTFSRLVVQSDHCETGQFLAEYVGPDVADGDDPQKSATLEVSRGLWHYKPIVSVTFTYGGVSTLHRAMPHYTHSLVVKVPLLLEDVLSVFYKPPGWKAAGELALSGKDAPAWRDCFPIDKLPEPPMRVRAGGAIEATYRCELLEPVVDARGQRWYDESSAVLSLPVATHVTATCSTGIEEFKRGDRAHYLDDLELGLVGIFAPEFLALPTMRNFFEALELNTEEPPDLYYRFDPTEARQLAGYPANDHKALWDLVHPPKPPPKRKAPMRVLRKLRDVYDDSESEEEWDPDLRRRQKAAARAATQAQLADLARGESFHTTGAEHWLPARASRSQAEQSESDTDSESESDVDSFIVPDDDDNAIMANVDSDDEMDSDNEPVAPPPLPPPPPAPSAAGPSGLRCHVDSDDEDIDALLAPPPQFIWASWMNHGATLPDLPAGRRNRRKIG